MKQYTSMEHALRTVYPEYPWESHKFRSTWSDVDKQREIIEKIGKELDIKKVSYLSFHFLLFSLFLSFLYSYSFPL